LFNPFTLSEYSPEAEFILTFVYVLTNKKNIVCEDTNDGTISFVKTQTMAQKK